MHKEVIDNEVDLEMSPAQVAAQARRLMDEINRAQAKAFLDKAFTMLNLTEVSKRSDARMAQARIDKAVKRR